MALVGSYVGLSKLLVAAFPVFLLAWLRFGIAAVAMLHWLRRLPGDATLSPRDRNLLFWESFLGNFGFSICMLFGVAATSATAAGVVMAAIPAAVALLSRAVLYEPIAPRVRLAILLAVAGIAMLALARDPHAATAVATGSTTAGDALGASAASAATGATATSGATNGPAAPWWGYLLLLGAVFCEASYVVIGKQLSATVSPRRISALINLWGLALITPFGLWQALRFDFGAITLDTWALLVFYAIAASMVTVWLWMHGLRHVPAARAGVVTVCLPIASALVGVTVLGEPFGPAHIAAMTLALTGLLLATWPTRQGASER